MSRVHKCWHLSEFFLVCNKMFEQKECKFGKYIMEISIFIERGEKERKEKHSKVIVPNCSYFCYCCRQQGQVSEDFGEG